MSERMNYEQATELFRAVGERKQPKTLDTALTINGTSAATVEDALSALNTEKVNDDDPRLTDDRNAADVYNWAKAETKPAYTADEVGAIASTEKGANNGVAELDSTGKVPSAQLPSYVDDVLEYDDQAAFPASGEAGKIYIAKDTNKTYRWSGTAYVEISESLALGETSSTAYAGNKGKANADAIAAIKDGSSIDSFGDVETALEDKISKSATAGLVKNDGSIDTNTYLTEHQTVDSTLNSSSTNPLQNKIIYQNAAQHTTSTDTTATTYLSFTIPMHRNGRYLVAARGSETLLLGVRSNSANQDQSTPTAISIVRLIDGYKKIANWAYTYDTEAHAFTVYFKVAAYSAEIHLQSLLTNQDIPTIARSTTEPEVTWREIPTVVTEQYELPTASADTLGGIKVGDNLTIDENGVLSVPVDAALSDTSESPVQNKAVDAALAGKIDAALTTLTDANQTGDAGKIKYYWITNSTSNVPSAPVDIKSGTSEFRGLLEVAKSSDNAVTVQNLTIWYYGLNDASMSKEYTRSAYYNGASTVWGSWTEVAKRSEAMMPYHKSLIVNASATPANKYVLIWERTSAVTSYTMPIHLQGTFGRISNSDKTVFDIDVDFRSATYSAPVIRGVATGNAVNIADIYATFDTTTNTARIYANLAVGYAYVDIWSDWKLNDNTIANAVAEVSGDKSVSLNTSPYVTNTHHDTRLNTTSKNLIGAINELKAGGDSVTVDDALSSTSTNPVQNKVISSELNTKVRSIDGATRSTFGYTFDQEVPLETFVSDVCNKYGYGKYYDITFIYSNADEFYLVVGSTKLLMNGTSIRGLFRYSAWSRSQLLVTTQGGYLYEIEYSSSGTAAFTQSSIKRLATLADLAAMPSNILKLPSAAGSTVCYTISLDAISGAADSDGRGITVLQYTGEMFWLNKNGTYRNLSNGSNDNIGYISGISWESPTTLYLKLVGYRGVTIIAPTNINSYTSSTTAPSGVTFNELTKTGVDTAPTASSTNFVTSGGIKTALDNKNDKITVSTSTAAFGDDSDIISIGAGANPTSASTRKASLLWTYIKSKIASVLGLSESNGTKTLNVTDAVVGGYRQTRLYTLDLGSLDTTKFYPVFFTPTDFELDCEIHSPNLGGAQPYNQNRIHFRYTTEGWSDTPTSLEILSYGVYSISEIMIGAIGRGAQDGGTAVWIRGGLIYRFICNQVPYLKTEDYTYSSEKFTVGTNYDGGTNANVGIEWRAKTFLGLQSIEEPTFVVRDNETLRMWVEADSGYNYNRVYIAPGSYSLGEGVYKTLQATTQEVWGAGAKQSYIRGVMLKGIVGGVHDLCLYDCKIYQCKYIHDIDMIYTDYELGNRDLTAWTEGYSNYYSALDDCYMIDNVDIRIKATNVSGTYYWGGLDGLHYCDNVTNVNYSLRDPDDNQIDPYNMWMHQLSTGWDTANCPATGWLMNECSNVTNCNFYNNLKYSRGGLVYQCSNISNCRITGGANEYGAICSCDRVSDCYIVVYGVGTKNGSHNIYVLHNSFQVHDCECYGKHWNASGYSFKTYFAYGSRMVHNNFASVDDTTSNSSYADNGSNAVAATAAGGYNVVTVWS